MTPERDIENTCVLGDECGNLLTIAEAAAEIKALRARVEWQPIETAPRDGTAILVCDEYGTMTTVMWLQLGKWWSLVEAGAYASDSEFWPTHWMPLPPPPSPAKE